MTAAKHGQRGAPDEELRRAPIGLFDSGLGGLTVVRAVTDLLPHEDLIYLGDTARVPYGSRTAATVIRYAEACGAHLEAHGIKLLVVACNTVSAVALPSLSVALDVPVIGVIGPGARAGVAASRSQRIGVIATAGTVASGAYPREASSASSRAEVIQQPAPLLVPLVEEGWLQGEVPRLVAARYLAPLLEQEVDTIVLGCTHYPILRGVIEAQSKALSGAPIQVVDSALATARELAQALEERELGRPAEDLPRQGSLRIHVTDLPSRFREQAARFLGRSVDELPVELVDL